MNGEPADSDRLKRRPRWFQFDLRLLFVIIAAVAVVLSLEVARRRKAVSSGYRGTLQKLEVGEPAELSKEAQGWSLEVGGSRNGTITEVGDDFLVVRSSNYGWEYVIPFEEIRFIRRHLPGQPSAVKTKTTGQPSTVKTKTTVRFKQPEFNPFGAVKTKTGVPSKT